MNPNQLLIPFYRGIGPDSEGRFLKELWDLDDAHKESCHDYIQWLFPNKVPSHFNSRASVLTDQSLEEMKKDPKILTNLKTSFLTMLKFYGLRYQAGIVSYAPNFKERAAVWLTPYNHNFLRITRILMCLADFGLKEEAEAFKKNLSEINTQYPNVCQEALKFWMNT